MKALDRFKNNQEAVANYNKAIDLLSLSNIKEVFWELGRARIKGNANNQAALATEAAHSAGYFECLDDIFFLMDRYVLPKATQTNPANLLNFGASDRLLSSGDLSLQELNGLRK